jgi:hypothetical protein
MLHKNAGIVNVNVSHAARIRMAGAGGEAARGR